MDAAASKIRVREIGRFVNYNKLSQPEVVVYEFFYEATRGRKIVQMDFKNDLFRTSQGIAQESQDADCSVEKWSRIDSRGFVAHAIKEAGLSKPT